MPRAEILLFGAPRIERDNVPIEFDTRKALALLAYVVVTGNPQRRDSLAALLWPEGDQAHARAALRRTLSTLNAGLGGEALTSSRELIALPDDSAFFVDVVEFRRLITPASPHHHALDVLCPECKARHQLAVELYREDFLAGFSLRDSPEFEAWQRAEAEALRRELAGALERLSMAEAADGDYAAAISYARRWLTLDRLNEPAHRQLMRLYAWSGERAASRRQYQECVDILDRELNVGPLEATIDLYQAISQNRLEPPVPSRDGDSQMAPANVLRTPDSGSTNPLQPAFPLVGRAIERDRLFAIGDTIGRDGRFVVIQGEAGIGKTRLIDELVAHARSRGAAVIASRCYDGELELAYGPFVEGLRSAMTQSEWLDQVPPAALAEAARLLPEISSFNAALPAPAPVDGPGALSRFFDGLSQVLRAFHNDGVPSLLVIDDVHRADEASAGFLTYLARRLAGWPLCLVVSWRTEDVPPEHRLSHLLAEVEREGFGERVFVGRLSRTDVIKLARLSPKGAKLSNRMVDQLYRDSEGVPFFVVEYLNAVDSSSGASPIDCLPRGVRDLLLARLAAIDETGRQLLGTAAIIGRSFDFDTLREASGRGEEETVDGLDALVGHGMIREIQSPDDHRLAYDFSHEKLRTVVAEEMSLARRRLLHRRVAAALEAHARRPNELGPLAGQIAFHLEQGGAGIESARFYRIAGEHDRSLYANVAALAHFRSALRLGDPETDTIHERLGDIEVLLGDYGAALASYEQVRYAEPLDIARLQHKLGGLHNRRGDWDAAEMAFEAALKLSDSPGLADSKALLMADWSLTNHLRGNNSRALALGAQALAEAEASGSSRSLAQVHNLLGVLARAGGDLDEALNQLEQSLSFARTLDEPGATTAALNNLALVRADREELDQAVALAEAALERCRAQGDRHREAALRNNLADFHHRAGRTESAMLHLKQAVAIFAEIGDDGESPQPEIWKLVEW